MPTQEANANSLPAPTTGGPNAASPGNILDRAMLAQMVALREPPATSDTDDSPTSPAQDDPENPNATAASDQPGQDNLPPEETETSLTGSDEPGDGENVLSQSNEADLTEALNGLNADARKHLVEMAQALAKGETSLGELKRGYKLTGQFAQQIDELNSKIEKLTKERDEAATNNDATASGIVATKVPPTVAKLKTVADVKAREVVAKQSVRELTRFLRANPQGGEIAGQNYTADQIEDRIESWQDELDALPEHAAQIQAQSQRATAQQQFRQQFAQDFPWYKDPDHPETKSVAEFLKAAPWFSQVSAQPEFDAAAYLRGIKSMVAELNTRKGKGNGSANGATGTNGNGSTNGALGSTRPTAPGKAPPGKPHVAAAGAPARVDSETSVRSALDGLNKDGSRKSLATLLAATGR